MGSLKILLLFSYIIFISVNISLTDHFDEKLKQTKIEIAKLYFREEPPVHKQVYDVKWDQLWSKKVYKNPPFIANIYDKILLIEANRFIEFSFNSPSSNHTLSQGIIPTLNNGAIKFVRSIVWKSVLYLLICYETGSCNIYTKMDNLQLKYRQTIQHKGCPTDANFFVRSNRLYLVVADNIGQFSVPSLIYHWRETYMDIVKEVMTIAAISVTTFKYKQSTIIIFAQNNRDASGIGSMVYEFKETSLDTIQFLETSNPISVHHYKHADFNFILIINEYTPSNLLWWDGHELLSWQQLPEIRTLSLVSIVSINDDTFFFVAYDNILQLYKFENASDYILIHTMKLPDGVLIDIRTRIDKSTIIMVLVVINSDKTYSVESWKLRIEEIPSEHSIKERDTLSKNLAELVETLLQRKLFVEEAESLWPLLQPVHENLTISESFVLPNLILDAGTVNNIDILADEDIVAPHVMERRLENLIQEIDNVSSSNEYLMMNNTNSINADILVDGNAFIDQLQIDRMIVDFFNDVDMHSNNNSNKIQEFSKKRNITVNDLKVDSICGIPNQYWALTNDTSKMNINIEKDEIEFSNNIVYLNSSISLTNLNVKMLNGININDLFNELFIINLNQRIEGNVTFDNTLRIYNFTIQMLNGKPWNNYMNTKTNQTFGNFTMRKLQVENLYTDLINGVPVSEAARVSTVNVIKGETKIAKLHVTEKLLVDSSINLPIGPSHQIYSNVTIHGNLNIGTLDLDKYTKIFLNNEEIDLTNIFGTFWTKSTDQIIENDVIFENNLTIDRLNAKYINGFSEDEFLYTTTSIIPERFKRLHFENVHVDDMFFTEEEDDNLFEIAPESVTIRERLHLKHLRGNQLLTGVFNGLLVSDILNEKEPYIFPDDMNFLTIKTKQINIDELNFPFFLQNARNVSKDQRTKFMKTPEFHVENLYVEKINNLEMKKLLLLKDMKIPDIKDLVINGNLTVKDDLKVAQIGDQPSMNYLRNIRKKNVFNNKNTIIFQELTVRNITLKSLHGHDVNDIFESFLSKSREQNISGKFTFYKVTTDNIKTSFINNRNISKLTWIDKPLFLINDIKFDDLFVEGDAVTKTLNNLDVNELYESMLNIPVSRIVDLKVNGNISWDFPSTSSASLTSLFENAVTTTTNQTIHGDTIFQGNISASTIAGQCKEIDEIRDIIADAVIDDKDIEIIGQKIFKDDLDIDTISVTDDIDIPMINNINIFEFNNSVARKSKKEVIAGTITFLDDVAIDQILVDDDLHNVPLNGVALVTDKLPMYTSLKDLVILEDIYLKNLDEVNFDEFLKNRVTIDREHEILANVQFDDTVEITGNTNLSRINGIYPSDLVLNEIEETQVISGSKIFEENVIISGNIYTSFINEVNVSLEYSNGIQNDEDVEIIGDLIFESKVKVPENVFVSNLINGINLNTVYHDLQQETRRTLHMFTQNESEIEKNIVRSTLISENLGNVFLYLEQADEKLKIQAPNIKKIDVVYYEQFTKLNMFGEEPGSLCGLPDNCSCPTEYMAELSENGCYMQRINNNKIIRNYHEFHSTFGINVVSNTISYSRECTSNNTKNEFIMISWIKSGLFGTEETLANVKETSLKIRGYIKDAKVFTTHDNAAFVVLAVYYDTLLATHRTNSVIYKIDFENNNLSLYQNISTDGAWAIDIFKANHRDIYLLLGCFGNSEKSYLYKLDTITSKFIIIRSFEGKTHNVKSLIQEQDCFVLVDDFETNAINIFYYDPEFDNFYDYQSLFHDSRIHGIECFYTDDFGKSDSFIIVTTENDQFYIYEYMYAQKFQLKIHHRIDDLQTMVPFYHLENYYIFKGTSTNSTTLKIIKQGP